MVNDKLLLLVLLFGVDVVPLFGESFCSRLIIISGDSESRLWFKLSSLPPLPGFDFSC